MNKMYGPEDMDFLLSMYSLQGLFQESHAYGIGVEAPHRWELGIRKRRACRICGRKEDYRFYFTFLNSAWNDKTEEIEHECSDHGGRYGKTLDDCYSGGYYRIPPSPPRVYIWLRNRLQDFTLYSYYLAQFSSSFFRYLFWWAAFSLSRRIPSLLPILRRMANNECES